MGLDFFNKTGRTWRVLSLLNGTERRIDSFLQSFPEGSQVSLLVRVEIVREGRADDQEPLAQDALHRVVAVNCGRDARDQVEVRVKSDGPDGTERLGVGAVVCVTKRAKESVSVFPVTLQGHREILDDERLSIKFRE